MQTYLSFPLVFVLGVAAPSLDQEQSRLDGIRARIELQSHYVQIGEPVWTTLSIENTSAHPITLTVPGCRPQIPSPDVGLPLSHVFSGESGGGVLVVTDNGRSWEIPVGYRTGTEAPILSLAPKSVVGTRIDLREYYPALRGVGVFRLTWKPYNGLASSDTVAVEIAPLKQAEIITDFGKMTIQFFYEDAPNTVQNFIELARTGFYSGIGFHRLEPGYMILGGCPRGDGTGIRPDGRRIPAEFNSRPHQKGSVSMALLDDDPDSASCQFFICYTRQKDWDGRYAVFGELAGDESFETLDRMMAITADEAGRPTQPVVMRAVRVTNMPYTPPMP
jgi:cyclophilin family peptidyl-prolyl cis-trans isomerase